MDRNSSKMPQTKFTRCASLTLQKIDYKKNIKIGENHNFWLHQSSEDVL